MVQPLARARVTPREVATVERFIDDDRDRGIFRVNRKSMTSPDVLDLEFERLFARSWLYVAHESEIAEPGAYCRRTIAGRPMFAARDLEGNVRVFFNTCTHRGALVCRQDSGTARTFQCFYHAWTYNISGEIAGIPDRDSYPPDMDWKNMGLRSPAHVESYRGFIFVNLAAHCEPLVEYLSPVRDLIDLTVDSAEVMGGWHVLAGSSLYRFKANWKLMIENSIDNYHFDPLHETYKQYIGDTNKRLGGNLRTDAVEQRTGFAYPKGHGGFAMWPSRAARALALAGQSWSDDEVAAIEQIRTDVFERFGKERGLLMCEQTRSILIFPNLLFQDSGTGFRCRVIEPVTEKLTEIRQWEFAPRTESPLLRKRRLDGARAFLGPGGFATPDDVEAVESCQAGFRANEIQWSDISRGTSSATPKDTDEEQIRNFWREWQSYLDAPSGKLAVGAAS